MTDDEKIAALAYALDCRLTSPEPYRVLAALEAKGVTLFFRAEINPREPLPFSRQ